MGMANTSEEREMKPTISTKQQLGANAWSPSPMGTALRTQYMNMPIPELSVSQLQANRSSRRNMMWPKVKPHSLALEWPGTPGNTEDEACVHRLHTCEADRVSRRAQSYASSEAEAENCKTNV